MNAKTVKILGGATLVVVVLALLAQRDGHSSSASSVERADLFPDLDGRVNDVAELEVRNKDAVFTVAKTPDGWGLKDKGGYPVDVGKVKTALLAVDGFQTLERKTADPERFGDLGLRAPEDPESASTRVTLRDAGGSVLADVILGQQRVARGAGQRSMYVRAADEEQCWEVSGTLQVDGTPTNWLDKEILRVEGERVARVQILQDGGDPLVVEKASPEATDFVVRDVPEGRELKWAGVASSVGRALQYLNLEDVKPVDDVDLSAAELQETVFTTFDGLVLHAYLADLDGTTWARFRAAYDENERWQEPAGPTAPEAADEEAEDPAAALEEDAAPELKAAEDVRTEVEALNARLERWVFALPAWTVQNFRKTMDELLQPLPEEGAAAGEDGLDLMAAPADDGGLEPVVDDAGADEPPATADDQAVDDSPAEEPVDDEPPTEDPDDGR